MVAEERIAIGSESDIIAARQRGRAVATKLGFSSTDVVLITTAISELARNLLLYARSGSIVIRTTSEGNGEGISVEARDEGPGIPDVELAMQSGYSTSGSLGLGLPGVRRLMDEMSIESKVGVGTVVVAKKWRR